VKKRWLWVAGAALVATVALAQVLGPGEFISMLVEGNTTVGDGTAKDISTTYDLDTDQSFIWDESADAFVASPDLTVLGGDLTVGDNLTGDKTLKFDANTTDATITWDQTVLASDRNVAIEASLPIIGFIDTDSGDSVFSASFNTVYSADLGSGEDGGGFVINSRFDGGIEEIKQVSWGNPAAGIKKYGETRLTGNSTLGQDLLTYTGTTTTSGHWKHSTTAPRYEWDKHPYFSEHGGGILLEDGSGNCYDCDIDTTQVTAFSEKSWTTATNLGSNTDLYLGGFYEHFALNDLSTSQSSSDSPWGAHAAIVTGEVAVGEVTITVTGDSVTDSGGFSSADSETIVLADATPANTYRETTKKWVGVVTWETTAGTPIDVNYLLAKYWDNNNTDFTVKGLEILGKAKTVSATSLDITLVHHKTTGWTSGATEATPPTSLASLQTDYTTANDNTTGNKPLAWKRTDLDQAIDSSGSEGILFRVEQGASNMFLSINAMLRIQSDLPTQSNWACTATACP